MSLKKQTFSGVFWIFIDTFLLKGMPFCATFILARILGPEEFGIIGLVSIFITFGITLVDSGLSLSLIRTANSDDQDYSTVFFVNIGISIVLYFLLFFSSPFISEFFKQPMLSDIIRLYCLTFILSAFCAVQIALMMKNLEFKKLMLCNMPGALIGVAVALILGYSGYGIWSLVWMYLSTQIFQTLALWYFSNWNPKFIFSVEKLKVHFKFGYKLMLSGLLDNTFKNLYNFIFGKFYSIQQLGFYDRANSLNEYPVLLITGIINKVSYPILSSIQNDKNKIAKIYKTSLQLTFFVTAPVMLGIAAVIQPIILLVLGDKWIAAVPFFQIISLGVIFYPIHAFNINVLKVYGKSSLFLKLEVIKKIIIIILILLSIPFGIYGLLWSTVLTSIFALLINSYYSSEMIQYPVKKQIIDMLPTLIISLIVAGIMGFIKNLFLEFNFIIQIIIPSVTGIILYIVLNYVFKIPSFLYTIELIKNRKAS